MTIARILLYSLALMLALLLGAGIYYYLNLPSLVEQQAKQYLQDYGVETLRYERLKISNKQLRTDTLYLNGVYNGMAYEATLSSLEVRYNWRKLLSGEVKSVVLDDLKLALVESTAQGNTDAPGTVEVSDLLPQAYLNSLPLEFLQIRRWKLNYHRGSLPPLSASGSIQISDQLKLQLSGTHEDTAINAEIWTEGVNALPHANIRLTDENEDVAQLSVSIAPADTAHWRWSLEGKLDYKPLLVWLRRVGGQIWPSLEISALDGLALVGRTTFQANVTHPNQLQITELPGQTVISQFNVKASTANAIEQLDYPDTVRGVNALVAIDLTLENGDPRLALGPTEMEGTLSTGLLSLPVETQDWLGWKDTLPISWKNPEELIISTAPEGGWLLQLRNNTLALGDKDSKLRWQALDLNTSFSSAQNWHIDAEVSARLIARLRKKQLPEMILKFSHSGPPDQSVFSLSLDDIAESMSLSLQGEANLDSGRGNYLASFSSADLAYASETVMPLMRSFGLLSKTQDIVLSDGRMSLQSELQSQSFSVANLKQHSKLSIENLAGIYEDYRFGGVALNAHWTGIEQWQTKTPVEISLATLNLGFELIDTRVRLSLPAATPIAQPVVKILSFSSDVFGGRIFLPEPQSWDVAASSNKITLRAEDWRLADMVALQQGQEIQAQGILEGELPVTVSGGRLIISNGYLQALPPGGIIRYIANDASKALATSSPELGMALDLLSDFQYEVLSSKVELDESGKLLLGLSLAGKNPAQYEGRAINFNINLEQNLDPLLQSLRLSDKLVEQLEGRIN